MIVIALIAVGIAIAGATRHAWRHHSFCMQEAGFAHDYKATYLQYASDCLEQAKNWDDGAQRHREIVEMARKDFATRKERDRKEERGFLKQLQDTVEKYLFFAHIERQRSVNARGRAEEWASLENRFQHAAWQPWTRIDRLEEELEDNFAIEDDVQRLE